MSERKKRERSSNFNTSEILLLTELVTKHKSVIENKKTDTITNNQKDAAWRTIATIFNAALCGPEERTAKTLKAKYEGLKKNSKKKMQELDRTGGGPSAAPVFDIVEDKVLAVCSNISRLDAQNNCDNFADITEAVVPLKVTPSIQEDKPTTYNNIKIEEGTLETPDAGELVNPAVNIKAEPPDIEEVTKQLDDAQKNWVWNPKSLKPKKPQILKPSKATATDKIELCKARLELVKLQKEIAIKEHAFVEEEHELKIMHLQNEERRKQELHALMLITMQKNLQ